MTIVFPVTRIGKFDYIELNIIALVDSFTYRFATFLTYYTLSYNLRSFSGNRSLNMFYGGIVDLAAMLLVIAVANWWVH